jgi:hypothetical protein
MTAVMEKPPADEADAEADAEADVARADTVAQLVGQRLTEAETAVTEAHIEMRGLALLAEIDGTMAAQRDAVRARLRDAEQRLTELTAAQEAARDLSRQARARALEARKDSDWAAAADLLTEAGVTAGALDSLLAQAGDLYRQLQQQVNEAAERVGRHLARPEYNVAVPNIELNNMLRLVLSNNGGPEVDPSATLHLDPGERAQASLASLIEHHARQVMGYRPTTVTEEEPSHDD